MERPPTSLLARIVAWEENALPRCYARSKRVFSDYDACVEAHLRSAEEVNAVRAFGIARLQRCLKEKPYALCMEEVGAEVAALVEQLLPAEGEREEGD